MLLPCLGFSVGGDTPTLTGRVADDTTANNKGDITVGADSYDKFRYRISVEGTGITEYYEFDEPVSEDEAAQIWWQDQQEHTGFLPRSFKDRVTAEALFDLSDSVQERKEINNGN